MVSKNRFNDWKVEKKSRFSGWKIDKKRFNDWKLDKKIFVVVTSLGYSISLIMLIVFVSYYATSFIQQADRITADQLTALGHNCEASLDSYRGLAEALTLDDAVQAYLRAPDPKAADYYVRINGVKKSFQNAINIYPGLCFIAIIPDLGGETVYKGAQTKIMSIFEQRSPEDIDSSPRAASSGLLRMSYSDAFLGDGEELLDVYLPVYSSANLSSRLGMLCMYFDRSLFRLLPSDAALLRSDSDIWIVDLDGRRVSGTEGVEAGVKTGMATGFRVDEWRDGGSFVQDGFLTNYRRIGGWNYYLISRIPLLNLLRDSLPVVLLLMAVSMLVTLGGIRICRRIIHRSYQPLDRVLDGMNAAADGRLDVRMNLENAGADFVQLAGGFNYMMDEIVGLMEQIRQEQQQMEQIRFNALQSQIQPHFLYNSLECIHWQAAADGNEELSALVKALAQYYRLCLSKGRDIIPLEQELEHVRNYLIIQNLRYDDLIMSVIEVDDACRQIPIPKLTLQPLVENAIYHGFKVKDGRNGVLRIRARIQSDEAVIEIADDGTGMTSEQIEGMNHSLDGTDVEIGYGVRNVNRRIAILFGREYGLKYAQNAGGGVTVTIRLPLNGEHARLAREAI